MDCLHNNKNCIQRLFLHPFLRIDHLSMYFSSFFGKNGIISRVSAILGVFLGAGQLTELEVRRNQVLGNSTKIIECKFHSYNARKEFFTLGNASIDLQTLWRGISCSCICRSAGSKCLSILSTPTICWNCFFLPC